MKAKRAADASGRRRYFTTSACAGTVKRAAARRWTASRRPGSAKPARACAFRGAKHPRADMRCCRTLAVKLHGKAKSHAKRGLPRSPSSSKEAWRLDPNGSRIMYQSDITQFINQLKEQKPSLEEEQRRGRALLWDKQPIDLDERSSQQQSRVNQTPYVYYQNF
jgi:Protein of unknown function (DUF3460)